MATAPSTTPTTATSTATTTSTVTETRTVEWCIVGAGPVGISMALLLAKEHSAHVSVFEARDTLPLTFDNSYPIGINPRALHALRRISPALATRAVDSGLVVDGWRIMAKTTQIASIDSGKVIGTTRALINKLLYEEACTIPNISFHFGHRLLSVDFETHQLNFDSGGSTVVVSATRVIGADGVRSACRVSMESNTDLRTLITPWNVHFRVLYSKSGVSSPLMDPSYHYIISPISAYAAIVGKNIWSASLTVKPASPEEELLMSNEASPENIRKLKKYIADGAPQLVPLFDDDEYTKFFSRRTFTGAVVKCSHYNYGEWMLLLGDAAHAVVPPTGEGTAAGLEDTEILSNLLSTHPTAAFTEYTAQRLPDLHGLWEIAEFLKDGLTASSREKAARVIVSIGLAVARKVGIVGTSYEELTFGRHSEDLVPYRQVADRWRSQNSALLSIARTLTWSDGKKLP
ncbi:FAD-dependent oxidoreductase [Pelomyxa schiedti]|nr:FAD-dependent oxidoreductase [Pelomyxa schiedti]